MDKKINKSNRERSLSHLSRQYHKNYANLLFGSEGMLILLVRLIFIIQLNMSRGNEFMPYYFVFHPLPSQSCQLSFQPIFPQPSNLIWTFPLTSTVSNIETLWPEKTQNPPTSIQLTETVLPTQENTAREVERRNSRRPKNKRLRNSKKELESAKKNSESNIVNQLYSFFNSYEKSQNVVEKAFNLLRKNPCDFERIKSVFYNIVRLINFKRGRKYVNKENILSYYTPDNFIRQIPDISVKLGELQLLSLEELCFLFRVTTAYFIRNISVTAILTSKRITMIAKNEHLKRRRKVLASLSERTSD